MDNDTKKNLKKDTSYYRKILYGDTKAILIIAIVFAIISLGLSIFKDNEISMLFWKSFLLIVISTIMIGYNKFESNKKIGFLSIAFGAFIILINFSDLSIFGIIYLLLGVLHIINSIIYLIKIKSN